MKARKSRLDQYAATLADMEAQTKTLVEMQAWLKGEGCVISLPSISSFLSAKRSARQQATLLSQITSGARQCAEVEKRFGKNPAPGLETLIKLHRVLILQLSTQATADPALLEMVSNAMKPVMEFAKIQIKHEEVSLAKDKFELLAAEKLLSAELRQRAEEINRSNLSNAAKIAAMRQAAFADVDELQKSGKVKIPKV